MCLIYVNNSIIYVIFLFICVLNYEFWGLNFLISTTFDLFRLLIPKKAYNNPVFVFAKQFLLYFHRFGEVSTNGKVFTTNAGIT